MRCKTLLIWIEFAFYTLQIKDALMEVVGAERLAIGVKVLLNGLIHCFDRAECTTTGFRKL